MKIKAVKIVVYVPGSHVDAVREAMGKAGAGWIGKYKHCSSSVKRVGRFFPLKEAKPAIGKVGKLEKVVEERVETVCYQKDLDRIIKNHHKSPPLREACYQCLSLTENNKKQPSLTQNFAIAKFCAERKYEKFCQNY